MESCTWCDSMSEKERRIEYVWIRIFFSVKVAQCLEGTWKLFLRSLSEDPIPSSWLGSLISHSYGQGVGRRLRISIGNLVHETLNCSSTSWSACWKQGNSITLCLSFLMSWFGFSSIFNLPSLFWLLACWNDGHFLWLSNMTFSATFSLLPRVFTWRQWIHKLTWF